MFEEKLIIRTDPQETRNRASPSIHQIAVCSFGKDQTLSLVAISQTLNKLVIKDLSGDIELIRVNDRISFKRVKDALNYAANDYSNRDERVTYVTTRDVINSLSVHKLELETTNSGAWIIRDLLFIGCSSSIVVYDTYEQTNLFNIHTTGGIASLLCSDSRIPRVDPVAWPVIVGGGIQKLYVIQMERLNTLFPTSNLDKLLNIEVSSERSTSDTVSCMCHVRCETTSFIVTGSIERKIRVYPLDSQDHNIQGCSSTLNESATVNCLCSIPTVRPNDKTNEANPIIRSALEEMAQHSLARIREQHNDDQGTQSSTNEGLSQMNHFAYGLANGFIGVYRLIFTALRPEKSNDGQKRLIAERLWRHKSRQVPVSVVLYDVDGDGLDELVFGYSNGRLEARMPFTGQLVAKTRCFRSDKLIGLVTLNTIDLKERVPASVISHQDNETMEENISSINSHQTMLLACSVSMSFVSFWLDKSKPHKPILDRLATRSDGLAQFSRGESIDELDESENITDSLIDFPSMGAEVPQDDQLEISSKADMFGIHLTDERYDGLLAPQDQIDNLKPVQCEGKQNSDLLSRLGALHNDTSQLRQNISKFYFDQVQQMSLFELDTLAGGIDMTYRWDFDANREKLRLSVLISNLVGVIEMIEVVDNDGDLIKSGHFLMNPYDNDNNHGNAIIRKNSNNRASKGAEDNKFNLLLLPIEPNYQDSETILRLRVYCLQPSIREIRSNEMLDLSRQNQQPSQSSVVLRVYEETILMPRFSTFVPEVPSQLGETPDDILTMSFKLAEGTSYLQILNWMRANFLCFRLGQAHNNKREATWPLLDSGQLTSGQIEFSVLKIDEDPLREPDANRRPSILPTSKAQLSGNLPFDRVENWSTGRMGPNGEIELDLRLKSLKLCQDKTRDISGCKLRIACSLTRVLTIECQDVDVMVNIIESLVVDCLKLNLMDNSVVFKKDVEPRFDAVDKELAAISERTRQLEESEQRIQTELYEADEMIKNLTQQFAIANQLNEFKTSKELMNEISMMLDGAQNSAQAYQLNNKERLKMSREANHLRETISFLQKLG